MSKGNLIKKYTILLFAIMVVILFISPSFARANDEKVEIASETIEPKSIENITYAESYDRIKDGATNHAGLLTTQEQTVESVLCNAIKNHQTEVNIATYNIYNTDFKPYFYRALAMDLALEDIEPVTGYRMWGSYGYVDIVVIDYRYSQEEQSSRYEALTGAKNTIVQKFSSISDPVQKVLEVHDYLALNAEYDTDTEDYPDDDFRAYGILVNHKGVCNGYALAMNMILDDMGIDCFKVNHDGIHHAWNMVKIDDSWYHIDVTHDDPIFSDTGKDLPGFVRYTYFLLDENQINETNHKGYNTTEVAATNTKYENMPREESNDRQDNIDGYWYVTEDYSTIQRYDMDGGNKTEIKRGYALSGIQEMGDDVYYGCDGKILQWDIATDTTKVIKDLNADNTEYSYCYGLFPVDEDTLGYRYYSGDEYHVDQMDLVKMGDVNGDGEVTTDDAVLAKKIAMKDGTIQVTDKILKVCDFDQNGHVTINEARKIQRIANGVAQ